MAHPTPADPTRALPAPGVTGGALRAGIVAGVVFGFLGWRMLLVPTLIRSVEIHFRQTDAGMGGYFFVGALLYAAGSFLGGRLIHRLGSRITLGLASVSIAAGLALQGVASEWAVFVLAAVPGSFGAATIDVGVNALFLDLFPRSRGRALNLLHTAFSVAALVTPIGAAFMVASGVPWQAILVGTAVAWLGAGLALVVATPTDRSRAHVTGAARGEPNAHLATVSMLPLPLVVLAIAITCYVAAEAGVSDWLVRLLADLPIELASAALTLFWAGVTVGRLGLARAGERLEPVRTATIMAMAGAALALAAVVAPATPLSLVLFGAVGIAFGPIYPLIVAAAGARFPDRSALVTSTLTIAAVVGAVTYPPAVGVLSVTVGLRVAMLGTAALAAGAAAALLVSRRLIRRDGVAHRLAT